MERQSLFPNRKSPVPEDFETSWTPLLGPPASHLVYENRVEYTGSSIAFQILVMKKQTKDLQSDTRGRKECCMKDRVE